MIHYTCDRCRCQINPEHHPRYVVHIEVHCVDAEPIDADESIDHLSLINDVLESEQLSAIQAASNQLLHPDLIRVDDADRHPDCSFSDELSAGQERSFDLCPSCFQQYRRNPMSQSMPVSLHFSSN